MRLIIPSQQQTLARLSLSSLLLSAVLMGESSRAEEPPKADTPAAAATLPLDQPSGNEDAAQEQNEEQEPAMPWYQSERLSGDWGGTRSLLEEKGFTFDMTLTTYYQHVAHGGINTHNAHTIIGVNDIELTFDLDTMDFVSGGSIYVWASNAWGDSPSTRGWVGDLFWVNGAEVGDRPIDVLELAYEQAFLGDKLRFRVGKICMSCYFDTNAFAYLTTDDFVNYALNNAPNIPFPSLAFGALGAQILVDPVDWFYVRAGITDADAEFNETGFDTAFHGSDDSFTMLEFGLTPTLTTKWGKLPGHYRFGSWYDSQAKEVFFDDLGGLRTTIPLQRGDYGVYVNVDQVICRENPEDEKDEQGLGAFLRYSYADANVSIVEHFWSVGLRYEGLIPTRDADIVGFGVAQGLLSNELEKMDLDPHRETVLETYYSVSVYPWLTVSPDFQWILRPGGFDGQDAFVAGLRVRMSF